MRFLLFGLCTVFLSGPLIQNERGPLLLSGEITEADYCRGADSETFTAFLGVRLSLVNEGNQSFVVPTFAGTFNKLWIARDAAAFQRHDFESEYDKPTTIVKSKAGPRSLKKTDFAELKPSERIALSGTLRIPVPATFTILPGFPGPGKHVLVFETTLWPYPEHARADWMRIFGRKANIVTKPIITAPVSFEIPEHPQVVKCS